MKGDTKEDPKRISTSGIYISPRKVLEMIALRDKCGPDEKIVIRDNNFVIVKKLRAVLKERANGILRKVASANIKPRRVLDMLIPRKDH
jgi:hypothetical protein